jgi:hypothetical protein
MRPALVPKVVEGVDVQVVEVGVDEDEVVAAAPGKWMLNILE